MEAVPHPGPRPAAFAFPFAEAAAARSAIDAAAADLRGLLAVHSDAVTVARVGFEGETRRHFDRGFTQLMAEVDRGLGALRASSDALADDIDEAHRRREHSVDALADWTRAEESFEAAIRS